VDRHVYPTSLFNPSKLVSYYEQNGLQKVQTSAQVPEGELLQSHVALVSPVVNTTTQTSLQELFINTFAPRKAPSTEVAIKRRRLQQSGAVITHEEYTSAVQEESELARKVNVLIPWPLSTVNDICVLFG
jgi:hypothetical protein